MSYEGHYQRICVNGHYYVAPEEYGDPVTPCDECGASPAWENAVDDTNCDDVGHIELKDLAQFLTFDPKDRSEGPALYRIPTRAETIPLRNYWDFKTKAWVRLNRIE